MVGLRAAAAWRFGAPWREVAAAAAGAAARDAYGTALLVMATVVAGVVAASVPVTAPLVLGQLALAAVAVDARSRTAKTSQRRPRGHEAAAGPVTH
ncbi:hypothetical protein AB0L05_22700 [Nonomuraea pusilla]|uniref:hypothetical protein n=1 Tax=Nonomuraea pusilla TaxID=46177 RepID=UPI00332F83D6